MIDADDVLDAIRGRVAPRKRHASGFGDPTEALDQDVAALGRQISGFLEELPGDLSVSELRELVDDALHF